MGDYVGVEPEELPTGRLVADPMSTMRKYKLDGEITAAGLKAFVAEFERGNLRPHLKSEPEPPREQQTGPVYTLVGSTFESIVKNPSKDVLVEFYAPCTYKWRSPLENARPPKPSKVIAKIDATANDVE